jgi:hypothetical protein
VGPTCKEEEKKKRKGKRRKGGLLRVGPGGLLGWLWAAAPGWPNWAGSSPFFVLLTFFIFCFHFCVV